jgi:NAD-dependent deacetylase
MSTALADMLRPARAVLVVTGAGISTGSGIPDFRGPQGVWKRRQPVYFQDFLASEAKRNEYWDYKAEGWDAFMAAKPNAAHHALVTLERLGRIVATVTQNIDGLHQAAGADRTRVIELHGTNREVECLEPSCRRRAEPSSAVAAFRATGTCPRCACGGLLKFATISFGQALDPSVLARAERAARAADLVLALGSTLSVHPAASVPLIALQRGVPYVIINQGATDQDDLATLKLDADVIEVLPAAISALAERG